MKQLYSVTNCLLGKEKSSPLPTIYSPSQLPCEFSDYFSSKVLTIREELDSNVASTDNNFIDTKFSGHSFSEFNPVTETFVRKIIADSNRKTCELDPLPSGIFSQCVDALVPCITGIVNDSLSTGIFPAVYKSAVVRPLLKKPSLDPNCLKNFRPVSNLPFFSKLLEKIVLSQIIQHLNQNNLLDPHQSAYRAGHSTETALLKVANDLLLALDKKHISVLSLLDLSAAFDTIDHTLLLTRLHYSFGVSHTALAWFKSYLTDRSQIVSVNGFQSDPSPLTFGVPQGSVLGPVLFIMYTKPISSVISSHSLGYESFADDTQLLKSGHIANLPHIIETTTNCISDLKSWMTENKLKLNDDKTEIMLVIPPSLKNDPSLPSKISIAGTDIQLSSQVRNLGVIFDETLCFKQQISTVCRNAYYELRKISSIRHCLSSDATKTLICSLVLSRLDYGNALLAGSFDYLIEKLQKVQNNSARLITKAPKGHHITPLLRSLHWLPVRSRIYYKIACICFSFFHGTGPAYLSEMLTKYSNLPSLRSASDSNKLSNPKRGSKSTNYGFDRSFKYQGPLVWGKIPQRIRDSQSPSAFRTSLKTHLFK